MSKKTINLENNIMTKVKSGQITMKPRWYFILGSLLMITGLIGFSIGAIFLTNLSFFLLRQHGPRGEYRLQLMIENFSWWIPLLAITGIVGGVWLLKQYDFSYKKNFVKIITGFVFSILAAAFIIDYSGLNDLWSRQGPMRGFYQRLQNQDSAVPAKRGSEQGVQGGQRHMGNSQSVQEIKNQNCQKDDCLLIKDANIPVEDLDAQTIQYLKLGLADERKALATYEATIEKFGNVRPFINIAQAEKQHISMLEALFDRYSVIIPEDTTHIGDLPSTLQKVCAVAVQAEIDNDHLYQEMIPNISQEDIKTVFISLANASKQMHQPAFERCAN